ncbi:MAG: SDR family NAD(P)-dependent oxidoreductase [Myxococcota bacterium]|jgi:NAD(P)-dependent dehydrogenase (short-subunit alcohol dehydrogenase family)|nr:short-chain dehydrogenase [Deltaproteobacteria bacterium]MCP4243552.1 SDR family NAD(P)-dependent oxidoreductase [bacterium]MDP6073493.1 SDR family NAD(P)-dependent oxidoreductase [Myxococcota bacterium]MDP6244669.1 SDR family NAD(P)-dependent oxidoreductase [Myxococcota bacterium]MDP7076126.1 SDR family NAD(P)-dependent oxidoreductase [Myxococcota bacterium]
MSERTARVAVVSGGATGIGRAVAEAFAARGFAIAVGGRREARVQEAVKALETGGARALGLPLDVSDADSVEAFFAGVEKSLGPADLVVNCAGHARPGRLVEKPPDEIRAEIETGLLGTLLFSRRGIAALLERNLPGDAVFISSTSAVTPWPWLAPYAAIKAGIEQAARSLALECEGTGVRCLVVRVGNTLGTEWAAEWGPRATPALEVWQRLGLIRHGGLLRPEQVALAVVQAVEAPRGVQFDHVSVHPEAPDGDSV